MGYALDATTIVSCATVPNRTTVLHLAAMSINVRQCIHANDSVAIVTNCGCVCVWLQPQVIQELVATPERRAKLRAIVDSPNINGDTRTLWLITGILESVKRATNYACGCS